MSAGEITYRCLSKCREQVERARTSIGKGGPAVAVQPRYLTREYLAESARRVLITDDRQTLIDLVRQHFPQWIERALGSAERICNHDFQVLGHGEVSAGPVLNWTTDLISGKTWPRRYWADFDPVRDHEPGDPKVVLELNRHQHLVTLGRAYFYSGSDKYTLEALAQIETWIAQNPRGIGINWHSSLEIGLRALSWLWTISLLLSSEQINDRRIAPIVRSLLAHFDHVYRYLSLYSSPNTHLTGEALALYVGGNFFSELPQAKRWRDLGESILDREAERQILADGFHAELSSYYHCYTLDFYLMALAVASRIPSSTLVHTVSQPVEAMLDVLLHLVHSAGSIPRLSDDDGGCALHLGEGNYRRGNSLLSTGAILFGRPEFKWRAEAYCEESFWLLGSQGHARFDRLNAHPPGRPARLFPSGGYFVGRSGWGEDEAKLIMDCGTLGRLGGGHGHADALSIVLSAGDHELLVDPGTAVYNGAPEWRDYFRSTRAHNTIVIDGCDQAAPAGPFRWSTSFSSRVLQHLQFEDADYFEAEHDGYTRLACPVIHRRRILRTTMGYWIIADDLQGQGLHKVEFLYHFSPGTTFSFDPESTETHFTLNAAHGRHGLRLGFHAVRAVRPDIVCGEVDPIQGWHSSQYGDIRPAPVLSATMHDTVPTGAITVLIPQMHGQHAKDLPVIRNQVIEGSNAAACLLEAGGVRDLFVLSDGRSPLMLSKFALRGEFFWVRLLDNGAGHLFCVNASYAARGRSVLIENSSPVSWFRRSFAWSDSPPAPEERSREIYVRN